MSSASDWMRRAGVFALVLMLVTSMVAPSAMAAASTTADDDDECTKVLFIFAPSEGCFPDTISEDQYQNATKPDIYAGALSSHDQEETTLTAIDNHLQDVPTYVRTLIKAETVRALRNGSNVSNAMTRVNESIDGYYTTVQVNVLQTHSSVTNNIEYIDAQAQAAGLERIIYAEQADESSRTDIGDSASYSERVMTAINRTVTLANGSTVNHTFYQSYNDGDGDGVHDPSEPLMFSSDFVHGENVSYSGVDGYEWNVTLQVVNQYHDSGFSFDTQPSSKFEYTNAYDGDRWVSTWDNIAAQNQQMKDEAKTFVEGVYAEYNASSFDGLEILDANTLATQFSTNRSSTGYYSWAAAELGLLGISGNLNNSFAIRYYPADGVADAGTIPALAIDDSTSVRARTYGDDATVTPGVDVAFNLTDNSETVQSATVELSTAGANTTLSLADANGDGKWNATLTQSQLDTFVAGTQVKVDVYGNLTNGSYSTVGHENWTWTTIPNATAYNLSGTLYTDWQPTSTNGSLVRGERYNTSNADPEPVYFVWQRTSNDTDIIELAGEFEIVALTDTKTGESLNETTLEQQVYQTSNVSLTYDQVQQLIDYKQDALNASDDGSGGGGGGFGFGGFGLPALAIGGVIVLVVLGGSAGAGAGSRL